MTYEEYKNELLNERRKSHGEYSVTASFSQQFKDIMHETVEWSELDSDQQESLDMITTKIARILNGNQNVKDHWDDIAGYANLVSERLK